MATHPLRNVKTATARAMRAYAKLAAASHPFAAIDSDQKCYVCGHGRRYKLHTRRVKIGRGLK